MLETIRSHRRLMQLLLLLFIVPSFALFGLESYTNSGATADAVAKVAGQTITQQEWDAAHRAQLDRMKQMFGGQFDPKMLDTPESRQAVLDNLISQRVLATEADQRKLTVPDRVLQQTIMGIPDFNGANGKFDVVRYKEVLGVQGMTPAMFDSRLRQDLVTQQINSAIQSTAFVPKTVAGILSDLNDQERVIQQLTFKTADFVPRVTVTDAMLQAYYEKNAAQFLVPERVNIEYLMLSADSIAERIVVNDADLKSYYEQNAKQYVTPEQRQASHILITVKSNASDAEKVAARGKAETLLAQVRKDPGSFASVAKSNSQDPGSAESGGDLGFFGRGAMVKAFEDAAFSMKEGEISPVIESDFGFHIIRVTAIKPAAGKSFDAVKNDIAAEIKKQQAAKQYTELAETFSNLVYEQADSLKPAAEKLQLKVLTAKDLSKQPDPTLPPTALYNNEKFLRAIFSDEAVKNKNNTEAIEVAPNVLIAGRVTEYRPQTKRPFEEVKAAVRSQVLQAEAEAMAKKAGQEKLAALKAKDDSTGFGTQVTVSRVKPAELAPEALAAVFKADTKTLPAFQGVELPGSGYAIYRIVKVIQPETKDAARRQAEMQKINEVIAQQETYAYIEALKSNAEVKILKPASNGQAVEDGTADPVGSPRG